MKPEMFAKTDIHTAETVEDAIELAKKLTGKEKLSTYIMPYAANTMASTDAERRIGYHCVQYENQ